MTNTRPPLNPGDIIDFAGVMFRVLENHGYSGTVEYWPKNVRLLQNFRWRFLGVTAKKIGHSSLEVTPPTMSYRVRANCSPG